MHDLKTTFDVVACKTCQRKIMVMATGTKQTMKRNEDIVIRVICWECLDPEIQKELTEIRKEEK